MRKRNMKTIFISDDGVKDQTFIKVAAAAAEGVYASGPKDTTKNPLAIAAINEHKKAYGAEPGAFYLNAYSAMLAIVNAITRLSPPNTRRCTKRCALITPTHRWAKSNLMTGAMRSVSVSPCIRYARAFMWN